MLGFWASNTNVGNIIGYGVFQLLSFGEGNLWEYGLSICAIYAASNGALIGAKFKELPIEQEKKVRQKSFVEYDEENSQE